MSDHITSFLDAMAKDGFRPKNGSVQADDRWHPAYYGAEKGAKATGAYTIKIVDGDFAIGCYFTRKSDTQKFNWHSRSGEAMTPEEKRLIKAQIEQAQREREIKEQKRQKRVADRLTRFYKNLPPFKGEHPYLKKKGIKSHGIKLRVKGNELIVPCYGPDGKVWTIQRITTRGSKYLFKDARKKGSYFPLANAKDSFDTILLCEGFSTAASVRQATGLPVVAAIDSGNLMPVLKSLKHKYPQSKFVICADNDEFTRDAKGELWNVGILAANKAAHAVGGASMVHPVFAANDEEKKLSDFNDLHHHEGLITVKAQIMAVVDAIPLQAGEAAEGLDDSRSDQHPSAVDYYPEAHGGFDDIALEAQGDFNLSFRCLGYNNGINYYFSFKQRRIVALNASQHTLQNLLQLDTLERWETSTFGAAAKSEKKIGLYAQNGMNELCTVRGVFKEEDNVRGGGTWFDEGRIVVHCGDKLFVDGLPCTFEDMQSEFTYIAAPKFMKPSDKALTNEEAVKLRTICEAVTWENVLSGSLLAGWLVIAPICGALDYRPHIWVQGESQSGKSTVINKIVRRLLGKMAVNYEFGTTEAKIRQSMGHDARPLVYDEAEPSEITKKVIELARAATTGAIVGKFGQGDMRVRFATCFSSVNLPVDKISDESRISFLAIRQNRKKTAIEDYNKLLDQIDSTLTPEFSNRLIRRTVDNMDTLFHNIKVFQRAARSVLKSARASEQIGTMIAGLYLLHSTKKATDEFAVDWIKRYDWSDHTAIQNDSEPTRMLQYLSGAVIRSASGREEMVGELILSDSDNAKDTLRRYGILVAEGRVFIANRSQNLARIFANTDWSIKWASGLINIEGAQKHDVKYFSPGIKTSAVSVPLALFEANLEQKKFSYYPTNEPEPQYDEEIPL